MTDIKKTSFQADTINLPALKPSRPAQRTRSRRPSVQDTADGPQNRPIAGSRPSAESRPLAGNRQVEQEVIHRLIDYFSQS